MQILLFSDVRRHKYSLQLLGDFVPRPSIAALPMYFLGDFRSRDPLTMVRGSRV